MHVRPPHPPEGLHSHASPARALARHDDSQEGTLPLEIPSTRMLGPWGDVITRSLFQVPAPRISSSSPSRIPRSCASADCARRPGDNVVRHTLLTHIAPTG